MSSDEESKIQVLAKINKHSIRAEPYDEAWEGLPEFKGWLQKSANGPDKAYCKICKKEILGHKESITSHGKGKRHVLRLQEHDLSTDPDLLEGQVIGHTVDIDGDENPGRGRPKAGTPKNPNYKRRWRYNKEWESMPEFRGWLEKSLNDTDKAYCNVCEHEFRSHVGDIRGHSKTQKHLKKMEEAGFEWHEGDTDEDEDDNDKPSNTYIGYSGKQEFKIQDVDIDNDVTKRNRKPNKRYMYDDYEYYGDDYDDVPQRPLKVPKVKEKEKDAVFKLKVEGQKDPDFIEVDLPRKKLKYNELILAICSELNIQPQKIERLRKLPDTKLRKDSDVQRLEDYTELEVVLFETVQCQPASSLTITMEVATKEVAATEVTATEVISTVE